MPPYVPKGTYGVVTAGPLCQVRFTLIPARMTGFAMTAWTSSGDQFGTPVGRVGPDDLAASARADTMTSRLNITDYDLASGFRCERIRSRYAAPVPEINQRLTDTLQVSLNLWVGVEVVLYVVGDLASRLPLEPGEEGVHIGMGEQVARCGRGHTGRDTGQVSSRAVGWISRRCRGRTEEYCTGECTRTDPAGRMKPPR